MSDRERWIVYPLLFLALGSSISTKMLMQQQVETKHFRCQTITMDSLEGDGGFRLLADNSHLYVRNLNTDEIRPLIGSQRATALEALRRSFTPQRPDRAGANKSSQNEKNTNLSEPSAQ